MRRIDHENTALADLLAVSLVRLKGLRQQVGAALGEAPDNLHIETALGRLIADRNARIPMPADTPEQKIRADERERIATRLERFGDEVDLGVGECNGVMFLAPRIARSADDAVLPDAPTFRVPDQRTSLVSLVLDLADALEAEFSSGDREIPAALHTVRAFREMHAEAIRKRWH